MRNVFGTSLQLSLCVLIGSALPVTLSASLDGYVERWSDFQTQLIRKEKSFQEGEALYAAEYPYERIEYVQMA